MLKNQITSAAIILAAGAATRFGGNKQLALLNNKSLLGHAINNAQQGGCTSVYVVSGHNRIAIEQESEKHGAVALHHEHWSSGQAASVDFGLKKMLSIPSWHHLLILPCDMPWFTETWVSLINKVARSVEDQEVVVATDYQEGPGIPAILSRAFIQHCYFANPNNKLRKTIATFPGLKTIPSGIHTKDVDYKTDLP